MNGSTSRCVYLASKVSKFEDFSGPYFPIFELNTDIYSLSLRIQYEYGKILTRKTSNSGTFHAVIFNNKINSNNTLIFYKLWISQGSKINITLTYLSGGFQICINWYAELKVSEFRVFLGRIFTYLDWRLRFTEQISVFSPNEGKYRPEKPRM